MSATERATGRLRQTFKYPGDLDSPLQRDEMDEEEQEATISQLQTQSQSTNETYTLIFTLLPLLLTPLFIYTLLAHNTPARLRMLCLLSTTSLLTSAFTMFFLSTTIPHDSRARLDRTRRQAQQQQQQQQPMSRSRMMLLADSPPYAGWLISALGQLYDGADDLRLTLDREGPLLQALPVLNAVMAGLLAVAALVLRGKQIRGVQEYMWAWFLLPGVMMVMTTVARRAMMDEEKGLRELGGMRYGLKGA